MVATSISARALCSRVVPANGTRSRTSTSGLRGLRTATTVSPLSSSARASDGARVRVVERHRRHRPRPDRRSGRSPRRSGWPSRRLGRGCRHDAQHGAAPGIQRPRRRRRSASAVTADSRSGSSLSNSARPCSSSSDAQRPGAAGDPVVVPVERGGEPGECPLHLLLARAVRGQRGDLFGGRVDHRRRPGRRSGGSRRARRRPGRGSPAGRRAARGWPRCRWPDPLSRPPRTAAGRTRRRSACWPAPRTPGSRAGRRPGRAAASRPPAPATGRAGRCARPRGTEVGHGSANDGRTGAGRYGMSSKCRPISSVGVPRRRSRRTP